MRRKTFGFEASPSATVSCLLAGEAFALEDDGEFVCFAFGELVDLLSFRGDLGGVQLLFGLACEVGAAAHRDRPRDRLGKAGDDDQRAGGMRGCHAGDDPERDEQAVLGAEHELADAREPPDPRRLTEGMLLDMPLRLVRGQRGLLVGLRRRLPWRRSRGFDHRCWIGAVFYVGCCRDRGRFAGGAGFGGVVSCGQRASVRLCG